MLSEKEAMSRENMEIVTFVLDKKFSGKDA
jgi:hypothetical protein